MFLAYLDSSGRPTFQDKENYVLCSVVIGERDWQAIDNGVKQIKLTHFPNLPDAEVEFHAKDMVNHKGIFAKLSWTQIYAIFDDIFDFVANPNTQLAIIAVLIDKSKLDPDKDIEQWAFRLLFERLNKYLEKKNAALIQSLMPNEFGISIMDSEGPVKDQNLRKKIYPMLRYGTMYSKLTYLIEDPLFTDSKWRSLSQLADCIAYCVRKKYRQNKPSFHTYHWLGYFPKIESKFDNKNGRYLGLGLKIFP